MCTCTGMDQSFIIGWQNFFKKHRLCQTTGSKHNFSICCWYFFWYLLNFLHFSHVLPVGWWFNTSLIFVVYGTLRLLMWLKSKKHKRGVSLPSLVENYQKFYSYICHNFRVNGFKIAPEGSLKMVLSMEDV